MVGKRWKKYRPFMDQRLDQQRTEW